ncbi:MAG: sugar kinase [Butyrivibrio sp.]|uniref:sugar kinase n=1 Tax=Butyrivibrio sp. TaxID=28121 RepID=UPI001B0BF8BA|nr:sugar kinase [Butyrivibrio sp.]MBO6240864.1 sugar kinase [Butyrivibrio sp.]
MGEKNFDLITLGEIMLRLSPPNYERMTRGDIFDKRAGGSELNVASGVALLGLRTGVISKLPQNALGTFIKNRIRFEGVSDDYLIYDDSDDARLGIYYYENGAAPRKPSIVYDRKNSSMTRISLDEIPEDVYTSARMFHTSGITLALNKNTCEVTTELIKRFKKGGALVSFDCNYRANLWSEEEARAAIKHILPYVDILFVSEETSRRMMQKEGDLSDIMKSYTTEYPVKVVCTTQREVISPRKHNFTSTIYDATKDKFYTEQPYKDIDVIDRIGSGDAYVSGVLYGLLKYDDVEKALEYGNATSSVKNTIPGDLPASDLREIDSIIKNHKSVGPTSELNR